MRNRTPSVGPISDAVRSDALSHLSVLAIQSGGEIAWDPKAYRMISPESLRNRMSQPIRGTGNRAEENSARQIRSNNSLQVGFTRDHVSMITSWMIP